MRKRVIKKYGGSYVIMLTPSDMKDFDLQEGDEVDVEDMVYLYKDRKYKAQLNNKGGKKK